MSRKSWSIIALLLAVAAVVGGWWFWQGDATDTRTGQPNRAGGRRAAAARSDAAVPVLVAPVTARDVPVYRDGIGNVQAYAAITVRAQIDGKLLSVDFKEGQDVKRGDVLARIDPAVYQAQYDQALAKKAQDQANLANARVDLERYVSLAASNAGSRQQAEGQKALVAQLEAQVRSDQAAIDNAKAVLDYTTILAPIDGRAGLKQIDAGNIIRASDPNGLVGIMQVKPIAVVFTLPQRDFAVITEAMQRGTVPVQALDADGRSPLARGTVEVVDNQMDSTTGTFKLKAVFPNDTLKLWPGQFVTARVQVQLLTGALTIPTPALRRGPDGTFVYIVTDNEKATVRKVRTTLQDETVTVLAEGVTAGERVVTSGFARLSDGKAITLSQAPAPQEPQPLAPANAPNSAPAASPSAPAANPGVPAAPQGRDQTDPQRPRGPRADGQRGPRADGERRNRQGQGGGPGSGQGNGQGQGGSQPGAPPAASPGGG